MMEKSGVAIKKEPMGFFYREKFNALELVSHLLTFLKLYVIPKAKFPWLFYNVPK